MAASDSLPTGRPLPGSSPVIGRPTPTPLRRYRAGEGLPCSRYHLPHVPRPLRREILRGCASRLFTPSVAFALRDGARLLLVPANMAGTITTRQTSLYAADRVFAPPQWAFDIGLRPGPFPDRAADLLPGLLVVTRTGLAPAGDNEHVSRWSGHPCTVLRLQGALPGGGVTQADDLCKGDQVRPQYPGRRSLQRGQVRRQQPCRWTVGTTAPSFTSVEVSDGGQRWSERA